jgi:predicted ATPase/DNA-binding SARP family transcriptional activator
VRIGLLGTLQVRDDADRAVRVGGHRVRSLLILLALEPGRVVSATSLIGRLWREDAPADAGNALQTLVSRLRSALRPAGVIESHPVGYRLVVDPRDVDAVSFETLVGEARGTGDPAKAVSLLREALALWRGPALADVAEEGFAQGPATRLEELRLAALHDRIEAELELGESASLIGELRSLVAANPLAERSRILLMRALQAAGRQADALAVYTQARELLSEQLGVDPSPDLERTHLDVLRQNYSAKRRSADPPATPEPPASPAPLSSFVGRDGDLTGVRERLLEHRLVTLTGPGGIGKTRLAAEAAAALDGTPVHTVELGRVTTSGDVPFAVLDAVVRRERTLTRGAAEPVTSTDPLRRLSVALADRDALVILDNCEHLIEAAADVADRMLAECPGVRILATSREPLRITGEVLWPVAPLAENAAVRLLGDRAAAVRPGFAVDGVNSAAVSRICQALDGMPLAIELAAVRLRMLSPDQLAERLADRFTVLTGGSRAALPHHQTLRAVVDWSWESLSKPERILARRVSVFPGGVTLEAAEGVCADASLPASEILAALSGLVDKSILLAGTGTQYRMLETIRAYGAERLTEAGEDEATRAAFCRHYLALAETADPLLRGPEQNRWLNELNAELDNIHAAIRLAIAAGDTVTALRFIRALGWYWMIQGNGEAESMAREVLRMPADDSDPLLAEARVICALSAAGQSWDVEPVRDDFDSAVQRFNERAAELPDVHPLAAFGEPMLALSDMNPERAVALIEQWGESSRPWEQAAMTLMRSQFYAMMGRKSEAEELILTSIEQLRLVRDGYLLRAALSMAADFKAISGDREGALAALTEGAEACDPQGGTAIDEGYFEARLAGLLTRMGDFAAAREHLKRSEDLHVHNADTGMWLGIIWAELAWAEGDNEEATRRCEAILAELDTKTSPWWASFRATVTARLATVVMCTGDRQRARDLLASALRGVADWVEQPPVATVIDTIAAFVVDDDPALAATLLGAAHTIRGSFDECSLDSPDARDAARGALGEAAYNAAYQHGRALARDEAISLAAGGLDDSASPRRTGGGSGAAAVGTDR